MYHSGLSQFYITPESQPIKVVFFMSHIAHCDITHANGKEDGRDGADESPPEATEEENATEDY